MGAVIALFLVLGFLGARARDRRQAGTWEEHVRAADAALEQARRRRPRLAPRGDGGRRARARSSEAAARLALRAICTSCSWTTGPGIEEDRAHFVAVGDDGDEARVVLARQGDAGSPSASS